MFYVNVIIINIIVIVGLSYFWSFWTHKVFKPWGWLEMKRRGLIKSDVMKEERTYKDRVRYYAYFFAMKQVEDQEIGGSFVMAGLEDAALLRLVRSQCPEREMWVVAPMEESSVTVVHENCQGKVTEESVPVNFVDEETVRGCMTDEARDHVIKGEVKENIGKVSGSVAMACIDCVTYDGVISSLRQLYPLMSEGGIIIVHSYNHEWQEVRKAVDEFMASVPEVIVPLPDMYGSVAIGVGRKR